MTNFKILFVFTLLATLISCGKNEPDQSENIEVNYTQTSNITPATVVINTENTELNTEETDTSETEDNHIKSDSGLAAAIQRQIPNSESTNTNIQSNSPEPVPTTNLAPTVQKTTTPINESPLRNLLRNAQLGKSYSKKELIENYKFPKEAVDLIKRVTCVGPNKLYFNWGSTWLVEKVSDAEFENDTLIFTFKQNKTYVSGGAIGIKYNKKIYTDLILNNGSAYIPSVKGFHWEINK